jgi:riboflavin biosynthesis pyrimidine reductase
MDFANRMNSIPKFVASRTGAETSKWNATLVEHGLVDEFHLSLTPVAAGHGERLFERLDGAPQLELKELTRFDSDVLLLVYAPR